MRLEIGAGEKPHPDYDLHVDVLPLPGIDVLCAVDRLPFATGSIDALRANHVLEHQSYELVTDTLREWTRVLRSGARVILVNRGETPYDGAATLRVWAGIAEVIPPAVERLRGTSRTDPEGRGGG